MFRNGVRLQRREGEGGRGCRQREKVDHFHGFKLALSLSVYGGYCRQRRGPRYSGDMRRYLNLPICWSPDPGPVSPRQVPVAEGALPITSLFCERTHMDKRREERGKNGEGQRLHHWIRQDSWSTHARTGQASTGRDYSVDSTASIGGRHSQTEKDLRLCNWGFFELSSGGRDNERG